MMVAWKFYAREHERYGQRTTYNLPIVYRGRISEFVVAICEKCDLPVPRLTYRNTAFHRCMWKENRIAFIPNKVTVGVLCHEMAHYVRNHKFENHYHNEALMEMVGELMDFLDNYVMDEKDRFGVKHPHGSVTRANQDG